MPPHLFIINGKAFRYDKSLRLRKDVKYRVNINGMYDISDLTKSELKWLEDYRVAVINQKIGNTKFKDIKDIDIHELLVDPVKTMDILNGNSTISINKKMVSTIDVFKAVKEAIKYGQKTVIFKNFIG